MLGQAFGNLITDALPELVRRDDTVSGLFHDGKPSTIPAPLEQKTVTKQGTDPLSLGHDAYELHIIKRGIERNLLGLIDAIKRQDTEKMALTFDNIAALTPRIAAIATGLKDKLGSDISAAVAAQTQADQAALAQALAPLEAQIAALEAELNPPAPAVVAQPEPMPEPAPQ